MSLTVVAINGEFFGSYATLAEALSYLVLEGDVWDKWNAATDEKRSRYLATATRRLNRLSFVGEPLTITQELAWPRMGAQYSDGTPVPENVVPEDIARAAILIAGDIACNRNPENTIRRRIDIRSDRAKDRALAYFHRFFPETLLLVNNRAALDLLVPWLIARPLVGSKSFGTGEESSFRDQYEKTEGFA